MTDQKSDDTKTVPGSGAGDAAHSTRIPSIERPSSSDSAPDDSAATSTKAAAPTDDAANKDAVNDTTTPTPASTTDETPKDEPTAKVDAAPPPAKKTGMAKPGAKKSVPPKKTAAQSTSGESPSGERTDDKGRTRPASGTGTVGRPLTASDYARTTQATADATSVIPAVKDDETVETEAPAPEPETTTTSKVVLEPVDEPAATETAAPPADGPTPGRSAIFRLAYIEPWSVTRMAFAVSVALMIVAVVATAIFWLVLEVTGVWEQIDGSVTSVLSDDASGFNITDYLGFTRMVGLALVLSALNVVILTALATIAAHLYNLAAQMLGGFHVKFISKS